MKPKTLPLGTISSGTLRPEDLLQAYLDAAESVQLSRAHRADVRRIQRHPHHEDDHITAECILDDVDELGELLDNYVPPACYLGSLEGDGAEIGVWPDDIEDHVHGREAIKINAGEPFPSPRKAGCGLLYSVTDHGNVTCYRAGGNRWIECWSVV